MAWTPLAGGALTGKYLGGATPAEGRLVKYPRFMQRYLNGPSVAATEKYKAIADKVGPAIRCLPRHRMPFNS
jgi:aryl-alcohol dehydrogenase-like predicted oxidoreductase